MKRRAPSVSLIWAPAILLAAAATGSCSPDASEPIETGPVIETVDGTTTIRNPARGTWGADATLIEEVSIGEIEGEAPYLFGAVMGIAAGDDRIYVSDMQNVVVRTYDWDGRHLADVGRQGQGPGEFQQPIAMVVTEEGRLLVWDRQQRRVLVFSADGEHLGDWPLERGFRAELSDKGTAYLIQEFLRAAPGETYASWAAFREDGMIEEWTPFPTVEGASELSLGLGEETFQYLELMAVFLGGGAQWRDARLVPFSPQILFTVSPAGDVIHGLSDTYRFEILRPDGSRTVVEKDWDPVAVDPDEAAWHRARLTAQWNAAISAYFDDREWVWSGPDIPDRKAAFRHLIADRSGRIWAIREEPGLRVPECEPEPADFYGYVDSPCWRQPYVADVFHDGTFLGSVPLPDGLRYDVVPYIKDDTFIALHDEALSVQRVKRYRISIPDGP